MGDILSKYYLIPVLVIWVVILFLYFRSIVSGIKLIKKYPGAEKRNKAVYWPLAAIIAMLVTFALTLPLSYDESFTFNEFTSKDILTSISNYPVPNNHVFHSILTNITWAIFSFTRSEMAVRLPALLFTALSLYFIYTRFFIERLFSVLLFSVFFLLSPNIIEYAFQARGYSIQIFCGVASYFFAADPRVNQYAGFRERINAILLLSVIGMFTSPAYLYTAGAIYLIFLTINYKEIKKELVFFITTNIFYGATILLLYSPIIISQGIHQITANPYVKPNEQFSFQKVITYLGNLVDYLTLPYYIGWLILALFIWYSIKQKRYYNFYFLVVPLVLMIALKQLPFSRVFLPYGVIILLNACMAITDAVRVKTAKPVGVFKSGPAAFVLTGIFCIVSYLYFNNIHQKDDLSKAYHFKEIESPLAEHDKVYTRHLNTNWDFTEILKAYLTIKKKSNSVEIEKDFSNYNFNSSIVISTDTIPEWKVIDSTSDFLGKPIKEFEPVSSN